MPSVIIDPDAGRATARGFIPQDNTLFVFAPLITATMFPYQPDIRYSFVNFSNTATVIARSLNTVGSPIAKNVTISPPVATALVGTPAPSNLLSVATAQARALDIILSLNDWWNSQYIMRRRIRLSSPYGDAPIGSLVIQPVDLLLLRKDGKIRDDYADIEVIFRNDETQAFTRVDHYIEDDILYFPIVDDLPIGSQDENSYYIYYSNPNLSSQPEQTLYVPDMWPVEALPNTVGIAYTRPGEHWVDGAASEPLAVTTLTFISDRVRIVSTKNIDQGIAEVRLDEGLWEDVDLFYPEELLEQVVYTKIDLTLNQHKLQVRVSGRRNLAAEGLGVNVAHFDFLTRIEVDDMGEEIYQNIGWTSYLGGGNG